MRIGVLALRTGVTPKAVRYYEHLGLLKSQRTSSGYRDFDDSSVDLISTIRSAQRLGVKLSEMDEIIALIRDRQRPCESVREIIAAKRREVRERIASLKQFDTFLARLETLGVEGDTVCPILSSAGHEPS